MKKYNAVNLYIKYVTLDGTTQADMEYHLQIQSNSKTDFLPSKLP